MVVGNFFDSFSSPLWILCRIERLGFDVVFERENY